MMSADTAYTKEKYLVNVLGQVPRMLTCLDQNQSSKTFGCFDRDYWHYKIVSTPSARKQEAMLTLALLFLTPARINPHHHKPYILTFIEASIQYLTSIQEKNGSFNEWYVRENSFVATAFVLYALTETILQLTEHLSTSTRKIALHCIHKSAHYLSNKVEYQAQNQESGCILALYNAGLVTGLQDYKKIAEAKLERLSKLQHKEGWFSEYGGPDIGYLSLTVDHLTALYKKSHLGKALTMSKHAAEFLTNFIHPDYTTGGTYGSRNTQYIIPSGIERLAAIDPMTSPLRVLSRTNASSKYGFNISTFDDRYILQYSYNWMQACIEGVDEVSQIDEIQTLLNKPWQKSFQNAGIAIHNDSDGYLVSNLKKGGSYLYINKKTGRKIIDSGVTVITRRDQVLTSSHLGSSSVLRFDEQELSSKGTLFLQKQLLSSQLKNTLLYLLQFFVGPSARLSSLTKRILRTILILSNTPSRYEYTRTIDLSRRTVTDVVSIVSGDAKKIIVGGMQTFIYVPSSSFIIEGDISRHTAGFEWTPSPSSTRVTFVRSLSDGAVDVNAFQ